MLIASKKITSSKRIALYLSIKYGHFKINQNVRNVII